MLAKPLQNQQGHPGPHPSTSRWRPPRRRPGRPARSLGPLHQPAYRTQRAGSKSALVASASLLAGGPARRTNAFFFFRQRTEGSALSRDEHEAPRMRSLIDATHPGAVGRAPPPERLSPIHPLGHGGKKEKEKKTTFPRKVQLGKSRGNPQDRKTTRCLILLRAGGWRVLNRSCDHVLRKTRFSTLQTLVTGGGQIVRLWSASLGGSKGRPIDKSNRPAREGE